MKGRVDRTSLVSLILGLQLFFCASRERIRIGCLRKPGLSSGRQTARRRKSSR